MKQILPLVLTLFASGLSSAQAASTVSDVGIYQYVTPSRPVAIYSGPSRWIESIDLNWQGARYSDVTAHIYADGTEIWSGSIPAVDPTYRATVGRAVSYVEVRVDQGMAYLNWARIYSASPNSSPCEVAPLSCGGNFNGDFNSAQGLARDIVTLANQLQERSPPESNRDHILPLKVAAARVFAVAVGSGNAHLGDLSDTVYALEREFSAQEGYVSELLVSNSTFEQGLALMTIREKYKSLFGHVRY